MPSLATKAALAALLRRWTRDPEAFVCEAFCWGRDNTSLAGRSGPYEWQREELRAIKAAIESGAILREPHQSAVASGHGVGKSALASWLILWAVITYPEARGVVTANTENQLRTKTWPEVTKWHALLKDADLRAMFEITATALFSTIKDMGKTWRIDAIPWSENNTEAFAGLHNAGKRILLLFDEASAVADKIWETAEGALTDEDTQIMWVVLGNPTRATGRFRQCFGKFRHRWKSRQLDSRTVEGTNKDQIRRWIEDYGEDSDFVKVRVRGMFPSQSAKQFISTTDVDAALGRHLREDQYHWAPRILTCDPAWGGDDELVIGLRQGLYYRQLHVQAKNDNDVEVAGLLARLENEHKADAVFVDAGYGTGIVSVGRTWHRDWTLVWFSGASSDPGCLNKRAEMWNAGKRWLKEGGAIPDDQVLYQDLVGPETVPRMDGKIQLEPKEAMKARGLPSPNRADALMLSFAFPVQARSREPDESSREGEALDYNPHG